MTAIIVKYESVFHLTDDQFYQLCQNNPDVKFERNAKGELIIMPPTGGESGRKNAKLITRFSNWNEKYNLGEVFDSSTGYKLANGANRSPDVSWIQKERWNLLTPEQQSKFITIPPDFALELLSPSDSLKEVQDKMNEYIENGVRLAWLIEPKQRLIEIYRPQQLVERLFSPLAISGEDVLPNFVLNLGEYFN